MKVIFTAILFLVFATPAFARFDDGVDAFVRANYALVAGKWQPLASRGDADAARNLHIFPQGAYHGR